MTPSVTILAVAALVSALRRSAGGCQHSSPEPTHRWGCRTGPDGDVLECKVYTGFQALNAKKKKKFKCQVHIHICERIDPCVEGLVALGKRSQRLWCPRVEGQPHPPRPAGGGPVFSVLGPHQAPGGEGAPARAGLGTGVREDTD